MTSIQAEIYNIKKRSSTSNAMAKRPLLLTGISQQYEKINNFTGKSPREKKPEAPANLPPKAVTAQQPRPVSSPSGSREEALTEGQEFYRAADILQAEPPPT